MHRGPEKTSACVTFAEMSKYRLRFIIAQFIIDECAYSFLDGVAVHYSALSLNHGPNVSASAFRALKIRDFTALVVAPVISAISA